MKHIKRLEICVSEKPVPPFVGSRPCFWDCRRGSYRLSLFEHKSPKGTAYALSEQRPGTYPLSECISWWRQRIAQWLHPEHFHICSNCDAPGKTSFTCIWGNRSAYISAWYRREKKSDYAIYKNLTELDHLEVLPERWPNLII